MDSPTHEYSGVTRTQYSWVGSIDCIQDRQRDSSQKWSQSILIASLWLVFTLRYVPLFMFLTSLVLIRYLIILKQGQTSWLTSETESQLVEHNSWLWMTSPVQVGDVGIKESLASFLDSGRKWKQIAWGHSGIRGFTTASASVTLTQTLFWLCWCCSQNWSSTKNWSHSLLIVVLPN